MKKPKFRDALASANNPKLVLSKQEADAAMKPTPPVDCRFKVSPRLQETMARAAIEAEKLGASFIGVEHVLLATLALEQGCAWRLLTAAGMDYKSVKFAHRVQLCM